MNRKSAFTFVAAVALAASVGGVSAEETVPGTTTGTTPATTAPVTGGASSIVMTIDSVGSTGFNVTVSNGSSAFFAGTLRFTAKSGVHKKSFGKTKARVPAGEIATANFKLNAAARRFVRIKGSLTIKACLSGKIEGGAKVKSKCKNAVIKK